MKLGFRIVLLLAVAIGGTFLLLRQQYRQWTTQNGLIHGQLSQQCSLDENHWIDGMIQDAEQQAYSLLNAQTTDLQAAAAAYRKRRGRHPPPGFDAWFAWGKKHDRIMVEEFFDQVHEDLEPYWGIAPRDIRESVDSWPLDVLQIRNGKVLEFDKGRFRTRTWAKMLKEISEFLPDVDMAINPLDEPRIFVERGVVDGQLEAASKQKERMMSVPISKISGDFQRRTTDERSASKAVLDITDVVIYQDVLDGICGESNDNPYVPATSNAATAQDICTNPQLLQQHGFFLEPATISFSTSMIPVFSAAKTGINNDILLPEPAYYFDQFGLFSDFWARFRRSTPWSSKKHGLVWRGGATGGVARINTFSQFHRHRFIKTLNSSLHHESLSDGQSAEWLRQSADVAFTTLSCDDRRNGKETCSALASTFHKAEPITMPQQFTYKYLPDIDGNSLSGRFRAFMLSSSAPIKATIFKEWHDKRLVGWKHYIPLSMGFEELYEVMEYFLDSRGKCAHDRAGERIAREGQKWAERVLGKEDMLLYLWRVVLEYARVVDDGRDLLGSVGDLEER